MVGTFVFEGGLGWDVLWQSTFFLSVGGAIAAALAKFPARGHKVLILAMAGCLVGPVATRLARVGGWGILAPQDSVLADSAALSELAGQLPKAAQAVDGIPEGSADHYSTNDETVLERPTNDAGGDRSGHASEARPDPEARKSTASNPGWASLGGRVSVNALFTSLWVVVSGFMVMRLLGSFWMGRRLVARGLPVTDARILKALETARLRLRIGATPVAFVSSAVHSPVVWCWGRRPVLVVPPQAADRLERSSDAADGIDWVAIFCHELAHWQRRDHFGAAMGECLVCLIPWQPLAWWARLKLGQLAERACDDYVLLAGASPVEYATSLMNLVPQGPARLALAAVSSRRSLFGRVRYILRAGRRETRIGVRWNFGAIAVALGAIAGAALAQRPVGRNGVLDQLPALVGTSDGGAASGSGILGEKAGERRLDAGEPAKQVESAKQIKLTVVERGSGDAVPDAGVKIRFGADDQQNRTDELGGLVVQVPSGDFKLAGFKVSKTGFVSASVRWYRQESAAPLVLPNSATIELERAVTIGGVVKNEKGELIDGATVRITEVGRITKDGETYTSIATEAVTDGQGRWTIDAVPESFHPEQFYLNITRAGYNDEKVVERLTAARERLLDRTAVLTIKKDRYLRANVSGVVLSVDGRPIEGAKVFTGTNHLHHLTLRGVPDDSEPILTDAQGRFRIENAKATRPEVMLADQIFDELYLTVQAEGWSPEAKLLKLTAEVSDLEFRLTPARVLRGQVVDSQRRPIAGVELDADKWRGKRSLRWLGLTDAEGRFAWSDAPADEVLVSLRKSGYMEMSELPVVASAKELVITMQEVMTVSGSVVDSKTGAPIKEFFVKLGTKLGDTRLPTTWSLNRSARHSDGNYEAIFNYPEQVHVIRIEAAGYRPAESADIPVKPGRQTVDFRLHAAKGPAGLVRLPDGTPANDAEVVLSASADVNGFGVTFENNVPGIELYGGSQRPSDEVRTDRDGHFELAPQSAKYAIAAVHEQGYAEVVQEEFEKDSEIRLRPWARVEGTVAQGTTALADTEILAQLTVRGYGPPRVTHCYRTRTDAAGSFTIERAIPGSGSVSPWLKRNGIVGGSYSVPLKTVSAETAVIKIGGSGRPVIGKVNLPPDIPVEIERCSHPPQLRVRFPRAPEEVEARGKDAVNAWYEASRNSDERKRLLTLPERISFPIQSDGSFRLEDVPAGPYTLTIQLEAPVAPGTCGGGQPVVELRHEFDVPEIPGGRSDEALDLGPLTTKPVKAPLRVGQDAPDFAVAALDGKPVRLADFRGKYVLVDFWATWCGACVVELPKLKALRERVAGDDRFAMIGLSLDHNLNDLNAFLQKNELPWTQCYLGQWSKAELPDAYVVRGIPAMFLIGPDGKIAATGTQTAEIARELEKGLRRE